MRTLRAVFAVAGFAALAWGVVLAVDFAARSTRDGVQALGWFVGGTVLHDGVIAPLVGVAGLLIVRRLPRPWRAPVAIGAVLSGVLVIIAIPLLWRPFGVPSNPGLHDGNYATRLLITLGVVWLGVVVAGAARGRARG